MPDVQTCVWGFVCFSVPLNVGIYYMLCVKYHPGLIQFCKINEFEKMTQSG